MTSFTNEVLAEMGEPALGIERELRSFDELQQCFSSWNGRFDQISRGAFRGSLRVVQGRYLRAFSVEVNQSILTRGGDEPGVSTFIPVTERNEQTTWQYRRLTQGQLIVKSPDVDYHNQTRRDTVVTGILVPAQTIRRAALVLRRRDLHQKLSTWTAQAPPPDVIHSLKRALGNLLSTVKDPEDCSGHDLAGLEMRCLETLVAALVPGDAREERESLPRRRKIVRQSLEIMHSRLERPPSALELCQELGVSDRLLRLAFHEAFGLGPVAYCRILRLNDVRTSLREAAGGSQSVCEIARRCGFYRLGTFAAEYHLQFGEFPSETLGVRGRAGVQHEARRTKQIAQSS